MTNPVTIDDALVTALRSAMADGEPELYPLTVARHLKRAGLAVVRAGDHPDYRAGMLAAAEIADDAFDCAVTCKTSDGSMSGWEDACDHIRIAIRAAAARLLETPVAEPSRCKNPVGPGESKGVASSTGDPPVGAAPTFLWCCHVRGPDDVVATPEGWQPIDMAPKDGRLIIIPGGIAYWYDGEWYSVTGPDRPGRPIQWPLREWQPLPPHPQSINPRPASPDIVAELTAAQYRIRELEEALKPFADFFCEAERFVKDRARNGGDSIMRTSPFRLGHLRAARAALDGKGADHD